MVNFKSNIWVWSSIDRRFIKLMLVSSIILFCSISSIERPSRCETEKLADHVVLGQLSHYVLVQHCSSSGLRLNDHTSSLFLTIVIT